MPKWQQWESASDADWGLAVEREAVIRPLAEQQRLSEEDVEDAVRHLRIGRTVLYKLIHRYKQRPQTRSLALGMVLCLHNSLQCSSNPITGRMPSLQ